MSYEVVNGEMPEEFHVKHLLNNSVEVITITCSNCMTSDDVGENGGYEFVKDKMSLKTHAAQFFYDIGWRYCTLPEYGVEGVFCSDCIHENNGTEDNTLQQPRETTHE